MARRFLAFLALLLGMSTACNAPTAQPPLPSDGPRQSVVQATAVAPTMAVQPSAGALTPPAALPERSLTGNIVIDGSSTVFPITEAVARQFAVYAPDVQIQLGVSGTGGGFKKFCAGTTTISDASRPISQSEIEKCANARVEFIELPIGFDGISIVVNRTNDWLDCITTSELKQLWEPAAEGKITRWNQIRPTWPDQPISLHGPGADSGTYDYFTGAIVGIEGASRKDYTGSEDDYLIGQDIAAQPFAIGFFGYAYYRELEQTLKLVAVDSGRGCVKPDATTIATGMYNPLSRPLFIYVRKDSLAQPHMQAFIRYYLDTAPQAVVKVKYVPLTESGYTLVRKRADAQKTGTVFAGDMKIGLSIEQLLALESK